METTIKTITGRAVTNIIIIGLASIGLAACSSTPAPWTQADDSPWESKHSAAASNVPSDDAATDTSLNDSVLLADPEPEPIVMQEPDAMPAPEMIAPVIVEEELTPEQAIMAMPAGNFAVQVYAGKTTSSIEKFKSSKGLENLMAVKTDRAGSIVYVLVDVHSDRSSANVAAAELEIATGSKPWVRSIAGLQKIIAQ